MWSSSSTTSTFCGLMAVAMPLEHPPAHERRIRRLTSICKRRLLEDGAASGDVRMRSIQPRRRRMVAPQVGRGLTSFQGGCMLRPSFARVVRVAAPLLACALALTTLLTASAGGAAVDWPQWGQNPQHQGFVDTRAQDIQRALGRMTYDPFVDQEKADGGGGLLVHYQAPILRDDDVFMVVKTGTYTPANPS